ncbi:MAG: hypothetical protein MPJ22_13690 [Pirellulales bacterium]|nr:hypothetical protein [Pirellulales bacterium]MDA8043466.1 hypothetical protein [Pirellulales bacterium]
MARILVNIPSSSNGYTAVNPGGEVMTHQGNATNIVFNVYGPGVALTATPTFTIQTHGGANWVSIPFNHTIRSAGTETNAVSIDTRPNNAYGA